MSSFHFALAFLYNLLFDLSLAPIMDSLLHPAKYSSWYRIRIFCLVSSLQNGTANCLFICFHSLPGSLMCMCVHICVEDEEKGEEREGKSVWYYFSNCASASVPLNYWSKTGSCVACVQISEAGSGLRALKILFLWAELLSCVNIWIQTLKRAIRTLCWVS